MLNRAQRRAPIRIYGVTIVTSFDARLNKAVTATRDLTGIEAIISLVLIAVIASLDASLNEAVSACRILATSSARSSIQIRSSAVITLLTAIRVNNVVAAEMRVSSSGCRGRS